MGQIKITRKAMAMHWLIIVVVMAVVLVALFTIPRMIGKAAEQGANRAACKKSLEISEGIKIVAGSASNKLGDVVRVDCVTEYIETSSKKEELTKEFTEHMYDCWDLYHERQSLFDQDSGTYCVICKSIQVNNANSLEEPLIDYLKNMKAPTIKGKTYMETMGGIVNLAQGAESIYNFYSFTRGDKIAVIVTFGELNFRGQHLIFDYGSGIGMLLHPYNDVKSMGCYSFEGRTTSLEYKR